MVTWSSDSCACVISYDVDNSVTPPLVFNFQQVAICPAHAALAGSTDENVQDIRNENSRGPTNVINDILAGSGTELSVVLPDGSKDFKQGITVSSTWSGTAPNRVLTITVRGASLTTNQRNSVKNKLDTRFGINNVVMVYL